MKKIFFIILLTFPFLGIYSQEVATKSDTLRKDALNVYMSASDYFRKEIPFVNYVRDIKDAGVYIISTSQSTGSGGREYSYFLVGQNAYAGMNDTITFVTSPDQTSDEIRAKEVATLKMGLMRYVAKTPLSKYIGISFSEPMSETVTTDKWNSWVFKASVNGYIEGEKSYESSYLSGYISAARVTKDWKINLSTNYYYKVDKYETKDGVIKSDVNSSSFNSKIVKSISDHWPNGGTFYAGSSKYSNINMRLRAMPGIEYDLFPYSESTRRLLRVLYTAGYGYTSYNDTTIYNVKKEGHFQHSLNIVYEIVQKWGLIELSTQYSNYFHDWSKNNLTVDGYISFRITKGLNVNLSVSASMIHDQLSLVKGGATTEQVLLRVKELESQFRYYTSFGLTYTFGSIYNNVVNPRFGN
jgi:hypothetical protein